MQRCYQNSKCIQPPATQYSTGSLIMEFGELRETNTLAVLQANSGQLDARCCDISLANGIARSRLPIILMLYN